MMIMQSMSAGHSPGVLFRCRLTVRSDVKRAHRAGRNQNSVSMPARMPARRPRMTIMQSMSAGHSPGVLFRCRLTSRSDVKRAQRAGRNQTRALMRRGAA